MNRKVIDVLDKVSTSKVQRPLIVNRLEGLLDRWPDLNFGSVYQHIDFGEMHFIFMQKVIQEGLISVAKDDRILDLGAGPDNHFAAEMSKDGYHNIWGIDIDPSIKDAEFPGHHLNFRDLSSGEKFDVIYFSSILDFFDGGGLTYNFDKAPSLELFAMKLVMHLNKNGRIIMVDDTINLDQFLDHMKVFGMKAERVMGSVMVISADND